MSGGVASLDTMMKLLGPMFLGSGTQVQTQTGDPEATAALRGIATSATNNANNAESLTGDIVSRIISKNAIAFAPVVAGQKQAGMYKSTVLKQLAGEAQAASTAEASKAVLDYRSQQLGIASQANAALLGANRSVATATKPMIPPLVSGGLGVGLLGYSAYKNRKDIEEFFNFGGESTANLERSVNIIDAKDAEFGADVARSAGGGLSAVGDGSEGLTFALSGAEGALEASDAIAAGADAFNIAGGSADVIDAASGAADVADVAGAVSDGAEGLSFALEGADAASGAVDVTNALTGAAEGVDGLTDAFDAVEFFGGAGDVASTAGDAISGVTDAASGILDAASSFGPSPLSVVSAGMHLAQGDILGAVLSFIPGGNLIKSAVSAITGGGSIICTELRKQGKLSRRKYVLSMAHFKKYKPVSREAYYVWSTPVVAHLRAKPESFFSSAVRFVFNARCDYLSNGYKAPVGALCYGLVSATSIFCGLTILPYRKLKNKVARYFYFRNVLGAY